MKKMNGFISGKTFERNLLILIVIIVIAGLIDMLQDLSEGASVIHVWTELVIISAAMVALVLLGFELRTLEKSTRVLANHLSLVSKESKNWQAKASVYIKGLSDAIDQQFVVWNLSAAEKDIAMLLLKGLGLKEIADARETSERTVRQQAQAIYAKSSLAGRAELAAFFLEDLFAPAPTGEWVPEDFLQILKA